MGKTVGPCAAGDGVRPLSDDAAPGPSASRRAAQAVDALRHGWPIRFPGGPTLLPAETAVASGAQSQQLLISCARAATLKLANQREAATPAAPVLIRAAERFSLADARAAADPALDLAYPLKGPFKADPLDWQAEAEAALELAQIAGILPAFMVDPDNGGEAQPFAGSDIAALQSGENLRIVTRARLPIAAGSAVVAGAGAEIVAFRSTDDLREHIALIIGERSADRTPLVRLHSECLTGDVLGSLKCDCGPQLDGALAQMVQQAEDGGWGVLLYLRQEGRGIGLINKLRAYRLQDQGHDTVEANQRLGLPDEARDFGTAARMLDVLEIRKLRLLTNNPRKLAALEAEGVAVTERVPHAHGANPENTRYLATKRDRSGHLLP